MTAPTQVKHPWRATARTGIAMLVGIASLLSEVLTELNINGTILGGQALTVALGVTRVLALPGVETFLHRYAPWLAAQPKPAEPPTLTQRWPEPSPLLRPPPPERTPGRHRPDTD